MIHDLKESPSLRCIFYFLHNFFSPDLVYVNSFKINGQKHDCWLDFRILGEDRRNIRGTSVIPASTSPLTQFWFLTVLSHLQTTFTTNTTASSLFQPVDDSDDIIIIFSAMEEMNGRSKAWKLGKAQTTMAELKEHGAYGTQRTLALVVFLFGRQPP
ncbi:hypothetical protein L6452_38740 [Arctium lappa]|uniref:Uncharacterized protein n=1 Tax=Arctium lappa TaxID=4217 RepID=A0ACB8XQL4_ARCLA|nr:hypothetical protein L6452_38740 [Arctium lappa]